MVTVRTNKTVQFSLWDWHFS